MDEETIVKVEHVNKTFKLPLEKNTSIKSLVVNFYKRNKGFEKQHVLNDISFEIKKGEFFGIVGRNGSGKSTMLKLLAGIYSPDSGLIQINGKLTPFIELGVGFNPELTGRENVFLNGALLGFSRKDMKAMYKDIVDFAEIEDFMDQKLKNYSSGMQVRLAFSIAIRAESDILLIDEVLAVGDVSFQEKCFKVFKEIKASGRTVVFVSHDLASVQEFCDRAVMIDKGEQIDIGDPERIVLEYETRMAEDSSKKVDKVTKRQTDRPGTGEVRITGVEILGADHKKVTSLHIHENFTIRIMYDVHQYVKNMICGLSVNDMDNVSIYGPNTKEAKISLNENVVGKKGYIEADFTDNSLAPGIYTIDIGIFNEQGTSPVDFYSHAMTFKLIGKVVHGKVDTKPHWSVTKTTE